MIKLFNLNLRKMQIFLKISTLVKLRDLVRKFPVALNKFKQYYMNIKKSCYNFELCNTTLKTIKIF